MPLGDDALVHIAEKRFFRPDQFVRFGGKVFYFIIPQTFRERFVQTVEQL